jgi:hypothetical protein
MSNEIISRNNWEHNYGRYSDSGSDSETETDYTDSQEGGTQPEIKTIDIRTLNLLACNANANNKNTFYQITNDNTCPVNIGSYNSTEDYAKNYFRNIIHLKNIVNDFVRNLRTFLNLTDKSNLKSLCATTDDKPSSFYKENQIYEPPMLIGDQNKCGSTSQRLIVFYDDRVAIFKRRDDSKFSDKWTNKRLYTKLESIEYYKNHQIEGIDNINDGIKINKITYKFGCNYTNENSTFVATYIKIKEIYNNYTTNFNLENNSLNFYENCFNYIIKIVICDCLKTNTGVKYDDLYTYFIKSYDITKKTEQSIINTHNKFINNSLTKVSKHFKKLYEIKNDLVTKMDENAGKLIEFITTTPIPPFSLGGYSESDKSDTSIDSFVNKDSDTSITSITSIDSFINKNSDTSIDTFTESDNSITSIDSFVNKDTDTSITSITSIDSFVNKNSDTSTNTFTESDTSIDSIDSFVNGNLVKSNQNMIGGTVETIADIINNTKKTLKNIRILIDGEEYEGETPLMNEFCITAKETLTNIKTNLNNNCIQRILQYTENVPIKHLGGMKDEFETRINILNSSINRYLGVTVDIENEAIGDVFFNAIQQINQTDILKTYNLQYTAPTNNIDGGAINGNLKSVLDVLYQKQQDLEQQKVDLQQEKVGLQQEKYGLQQANANLQSQNTVLHGHAPRHDLVDLNVNINNVHQQGQQHILTITGHNVNILHHLQNFNNTHLNIGSPGAAMTKAQVQVLVEELLRLANEQQQELNNLKNNHGELGLKHNKYHASGHIIHSENEKLQKELKQQQYETQRYREDKYTLMNYGQQLGAKAEVMTAQMNTTGLYTNRLNNYYKKEQKLNNFYSKIFKEKKFRKKLTKSQLKTLDELEKIHINDKKEQTNDINDYPDYSEESQSE